MAEPKNKPLLKLTTPKGIFVFPHLNNPDTKFNAEGEYRVKLKLAGADADKLKAALDEAADKAFELAQSKETDAAKRKKMKRADPPYVAETDKDSGEETGATLFGFKQKAKITNKKGEVFEKRPDIFDAAGKPFPYKTTLIYGGSVGKIAFEGWPFYTAKVGAGVTLRLSGVQVIELRTSGSRDASAYGFGEEGEGLGSDNVGEEQDAADESDAPQDF